MKNYHATILLVDDDPHFLGFTELALRQNGVRTPIHKAADGEEAIAYIMGAGKFSDRNAYPYPTFIVTDLKMPRADGFAVLRHLRTNPEWAVIPTVVFSASSDEDDIKKSYMLGASSYHVKPMGLDKLRQQMKILHDYWMTCECPEVDRTGRRLHTNSNGKIGQDIPQPSGAATQKSALPLHVAQGRQRA